MNVTELADELLALLHDADPVGASLLGIAGHDHRLPDRSVDGDLARGPVRTTSRDGQLPSPTASTSRTR